MFLFIERKNVTEDLDSLRRGIENKEAGNMRSHSTEGVNERR